MIIRRILLSLFLVTLTVGEAVPAGALLPTSSIAQVWTEPDAGYGFSYAAVASASHSIVMSLYELKDTTMEQDLVNAAHRGVRVSVLLNAAYFGRSKNAAAASYLQSHGVAVRFAPSGQIFHAKYFVIDGSRLYLGTGNLITYDYPSTRDFWVLDRVPRDVRGATVTFAQDWAGNSSSSPDQGNALVWSPYSTAAILSLYASAHHTLLIENEEMYSYTIEDALIATAARGVNITVVMTRDAKYYSDLSSLAHHGIHVRLLSSGQTYIHAKVICADCTTSSGTVLVSSINYSTYSLTRNRELGVLTSSPAVVQAVRTAVQSDAAAGAAYS